MPQPSNNTQETEQQHMIIIDSSVQEPTAPIRICWNTGEEKNCTACYLRKGCKAKE